MRRRSALIAVLALLAPLAGCGGGDDERGRAVPPPTATAAPGPTTLPAELASGGGQVVATSGCLACHRVASFGNDGPGRPLDGVGARLSEAEIRRVLFVDAPAPMPLFASLPRRDKRALVRYLASLR